MRVLVVEDDPIISEFITVGLRGDGHETRAAMDGITGLELATASAAPEAAAGALFDAVVLDLMLPGMDGFGILAEMRARNVFTPVLMLSALDTVDDRVRGLRAGADDYLVKPFAMDELLARLLALVRRASHAAPAAEPTRLSVDDLTLDRVHRKVRRGSTDIEMQPKEFALLEYFLLNAGRTLTRAMILEHVWQWKFDPQTNVVDVLVLRLRNKIDRDFPIKLIHTLRGIGYVLRMD